MDLEETDFPTEMVDPRTIAAHKVEHQDTVGATIVSPTDRADAEKAHPEAVFHTTMGTVTPPGRPFVAQGTSQSHRVHMAMEP